MWTFEWSSFTALKTLIRVIIPFLEPLWQQLQAGRTFNAYELKRRLLLLETLVMPIRQSDAEIYCEADGRWKGF